MNIDYTKLEGVNILSKDIFNKSHYKRVTKTIIIPYTFNMNTNSVNSYGYNSYEIRFIFTPLLLGLKLELELPKSSEITNSEKSLEVEIIAFGWTVKIGQPSIVSFNSIWENANDILCNSYVSKFTFTATAFIIARIFKNALSSYAMPFLSRYLGPALGGDALFFAALGVSLPYSLYFYGTSVVTISAVGGQIQQNIACLFDTQHEQSERYKHAAYLLLLVGSASVVFTYTLPLVTLAIQSCVPARLSLYLTQIGAGRYIDLARFTTTYLLSTQLFKIPVGWSQKPVLRHAVDSVSNFIPFTKSTGIKT